MMNVFEKMVVDEQDTDKKFLEATSFFISLKEPVVKTAAKAPVTRSEEREKFKRVQKSVSENVKSPPLRPLRTTVAEVTKNTVMEERPKPSRKKGTLPAELKQVVPKKLPSTVRTKALTQAMLKKYDKKRVKKLPPAEKIKLNSAEVKTKLALNLMDVLKVYGKHGVKKAKDFAGSPAAAGMLHGFRPPTQAAPGWWSRTWEKVPGVKRFRNWDELKKINRERLVRGLSKFSDLGEAQRWHRGFKRTSGLASLLGIPALGRMASDPKSALPGLAGGLHALGLGGASIGAAGSRASRGLKGILGEGREASDLNKYLLPAAGLAGAGGLGYLAYKKMSEPKQKPTPVVFQT